jgi:hypothetical protein
MQDDWIAFGEIWYARPDFLDPAGVFVSEREWHLVGHRALEDTFHEVQVRATHPRAGDADDHVERRPNLWLRDFLYARRRVELKQPNSLHRVLSSCG